ncbi:hypothetical protein HDU83_000228, partial [Entophlyctis luteolus]
HSLEVPKPSLNAARLRGLTSFSNIIPLNISNSEVPNSVSKFDTELVGVAGEAGKAKIGGAELVLHKSERKSLNLVVICSPFIFLF